MTIEEMAEEWAKENMDCVKTVSYLNHDCNYFSDEERSIAKSAFKDGYNKANEWHYPSKGEYPKEYEDILICFLTEDDMKDCVRGWYEYDFENNKHIFKYLNVLGTQYLETVITWKEIVLPKEIEK